MIKNKNRGGFIDCQRKGVRVGKKYFSFSRSKLVLACSPMFSKKNEKKSKAKSVYRLQKLVFGP